MRFLFEWQHAAPGARLTGPDALPAVLTQLEGYEAAAGAWETEVLPARIDDYSITWLDDLCRAGRISWSRLRSGNGSGGGPVRATPIVLLPRRSVPVWAGTAASAGEVQDTPVSSRAQAVLDTLRDEGALFFDELMHATHLLRTELEDALGELVAAGRITADSFAGLRALLVPAAKRDAHRHRRLRRHMLTGVEDAGRWSLVRSSSPFSPSGRRWPEGTDEGAGLAKPQPSAAKPDPETLEHIARTLLRRYGIVFWKLLEREAPWLPSWRELLRVYHRLEARGEIRGGRFVEGLVGEQFALPEAIGRLRAVRQQDPQGELVCLSGSDPLNLVGTVLAGNKLPAVTGTRVLYEDGVPVAALVANKSQWLIESNTAQQARWRNALLRRAEVDHLVADARSAGLSP
jgi:ATP-dependent Lhr-like helicase